MSTLLSNWNIAKGKLKQKISRLTANDEQFAKGKEEELIGRIQKRAHEQRKANEQGPDDCCGCHQ